jgi:hypothetical protein
MKFWTLCFASLFCALIAEGQSTVFSDSMGGTFSTNWTSATTGTGVASFSAGTLLIDNSSASGQTYAYTTTSSFASPYSATLASTTGTVEWSFNMRTQTTDPSASNRMAVVLAASSSNFTSASGYAVRVGGNLPSTDPLELIYFTGGVNGTITTIATGASLTANQYADVRVTYAPNTNTWSLFGTTGSAWGTPSVVSTSLGSGTNSTGTGTSLTYMGFWSLHTTAATQDRSFDNLSISVSAIPEPSTYAAIFGSLALAGTIWHRRRQRKAA